MTYSRVIPRDLFNEANLLKCYGQLYLCAEREPVGQIDIEHDGKPFEIKQDPWDGSLSIANVTIRLRGRELDLSRPLNSRDPWPLYAQLGDQVAEVFTQDGWLSEEFLALGWRD